MTNISAEARPLNQLFGQNPQIIIISVFLGQPYQSFNKSDIERITGITRKTVRKHVDRFEELGVIDRVSTYGYELNKNHPLTVPLYMLHHSDF